MLKAVKQSFMDQVLFAKFGKQLEYVPLRSTFSIFALKACKGYIAATLRKEKVNHMYHSKCICTILSEHTIGDTCSFVVPCCTFSMY
jgi:hypothetical protein